MITAYLVFNNSKIWVDSHWMWMPVGTTWTNTSKADRCSLEASLQRPATSVTHICHTPRGQEPYHHHPIHTQPGQRGTGASLQKPVNLPVIWQKWTEDSEGSDPSHKSVEAPSILYPDHGSLSQAHWFCRAAWKDHTLRSAEKLSQ